MQKGYEFA